MYSDTHLLFASQNGTKQIISLTDRMHEAHKKYALNTTTGVNREEDRKNRIHFTRQTR